MWGKVQRGKSTEAEEAESSLGAVAVGLGGGGLSSELAPMFDCGERSPQEFSRGLQTELSAVADE